MATRAESLGTSEHQCRAVSHTRSTDRLHSWRQLGRDSIRNKLLAARALATAAMGVGIGRYRGKSHLASMLMLQALDAAHAQDITGARHPTGRLSTVPAELLKGQDLHQNLRMQQKRSPRPSKPQR